MWTACNYCVKEATDAQLQMRLNIGVWIQTYLWWVW